MGQKVSLREYARMRGVRLNAVQTAVNSGRIHKTPDGKIDVEEANKEWFMNTDPAKSRKADPLFETSDGGGMPKNGMSNFQQAKTSCILIFTKETRPTSKSPGALMINRSPLKAVSLAEPSRGGKNI